MSSTANVQTVYSTYDKVRFVLAGLMVIGSIAGFYLLSGQDIWWRVLVLLALLGLGIGIYLTTESGKSLIAYGADSVREVKKVVWPTRQEALQMTSYVFAFVVIMALMLWLTDKSIEWLLYSVILGWNR